MRKSALIIGSFTKTENGFTGKLETLGVKANLAVQPNDGKEGNQPDYIVLHGQSEIGVAWDRNDDRGYLRVHQLRGAEPRPRLLHAGQKRRREGLPASLPQADAAEEGREIALRGAAAMPPLLFQQQILQRKYAMYTNSRGGSRGADAEMTLMRWSEGNMLPVHYSHFLATVAAFLYFQAAAFHRYRRLKHARAAPQLQRTDF